MTFAQHLRTQTIFQKESENIMPRFCHGYPITITIILLFFTWLASISCIPIPTFADVPSDDGSTSPMDIDEKSDKVVTPETIDPELPKVEMGYDSLLETDGGLRTQALSDAVSELPLLVVVVGFENCEYSADYDWNDIVFSTKVDATSLSTYYLDMSFGKFTFAPAIETSEYGEAGNTNIHDRINDGIVHVNVPMMHDDWHDYKKLSWIQTLNEAVLETDSYVDFKSYDSDGDGEIENNELAIALFIAGHEGSYSENKNQPMSMSSHSWNIMNLINQCSGSTPERFSLPSPDGVIVNRYIAKGEKLDDKRHGPIGLLARSLGSFIGLSDLYDHKGEPPWNSYKVGVMSLMSQGNWGWTEDLSTALPMPIDPWNRIKLGWVKPTVVDSTGRYVVNAQLFDQDNSSNYNVLRINSPNPGEYYLIEHRTPAKWDEPLARQTSISTGGLVIWHIDDNIYKSCNGSFINNSDHRPAVMPLYPEKSGNTYSFNAGASFSDNCVKTSVPFTTLYIWQTKYSSVPLVFPLYSTAFDSKPQDRTDFTDVSVSLVSQSLSDTVLDISYAVGDDGGNLNEPSTGDCPEHIWGEWEETRAATCTSNGEKKRSCTRNGCPGVQTAKIPELGHHMSRMNIKKASTKSKGKKVQICLREGCNHKTTFIIPKDKMNASSKNRTVKARQLLKKDVKYQGIKVKNAKGAVTYTISGGNAKSKNAISVDGNTGKVTVKKGTPKGSYMVNVTVSSTGNASYEPAKKVVAVRIEVR